MDRAEVLTDHHRGALRSLEALSLALRSIPMSTPDLCNVMSHLAEATMFVRAARTADRGTPADPPPPLADQAPKECGQITNNMGFCRRPASAPFRYCWQHERQMTR